MSTLKITKAQPARKSRMDELQEIGERHEGFREGYDARDSLIRFGDTLRQLRESVGLTQEQLASKVGMSQPAVSRLESGFGPRGPEMDTVLRFVHGCEASLTVNIEPNLALKDNEPTHALHVAL
jgi:DNA-binding XRE family transcriptional regulator